MATVSTSPKITKLPGDVQPQVHDLISMMQAYKAATDWDGIDEATRALDADCVFDSPFMYITGGRDRVRAVAKLLAPLASTEFEPKLVHFLIDGVSRTAELEMEGTLRVVPRRYWFAPITWILRPIPIEGTITLRVKSWNDKVSLVQERFSNIPVVIPRLARWFAGWVMGTFGVIAEPAMRSLYDWFTAGFVTVQSGVEQVVQQQPQMVAIVSKAEQLRDKAPVGAPGAKQPVTESVGSDE